MECDSCYSWDFLLAAVKSKLSSVFLFMKKWENDYCGAVSYLMILDSVLPDKIHLTLLIVADDSDACFEKAVIVFG